MKKSDSIFGIYIPFIIFVFLAIALFNEREGIQYQVADSSLFFLESKGEGFQDISLNKNADNLILYDSNGLWGNQNFSVVKDSMDSMRVNYDVLDMSSQQKIDFSKYEVIIITILDLEVIREDAQRLVTWVQDGGKLMFSIRPELTPTFYSIYRKLGILSLGGKFIAVNSLEFVTNLMPGSYGQSFDEDFMYQTILALELESSSKVHIVSADDFKSPILWEYTHGEGKVVFCNTDLFTSKSTRGVMAAAYNLLFDVFAYPVINASLFFIDDFPSPTVLGENELIRKQYSRDLQSFYVNIWWPDMQSFANKYGLHYTASLIESNSQNLNPPFESGGDFDNFNYFGGTLLSAGGEIGLQGFNHVPLCEANVGLNQQLNFPAWSSLSTMQESITALHSFSSALFTEQPFVTYVPPSNILCDASREWLPTFLPELKIISSIYLPQYEQLAYQQEFSESEDGIINLPRIVSGYDLTGDFERWATINEIYLHYISSHFTSPSDVLISDFDNNQGWPYLRDRYEEYILWLYVVAPNIRNMTAKEGGMAVQRFNRLLVDRSYDGESYKLRFENFYDEAWMLLTTEEIPLRIEGGEASEVSEGVYLLKVESENVEIWFEE